MSYKSLPEQEENQFEQQMKNIIKLPQDKEDLYAQKIANALKRDCSFLHTILLIKHSKMVHSKDTLLLIARSIFEGNTPPSSGYPFKVRRDISKLLGILSHRFDEKESVKELFRFLINVDNIIPSNLQTPNIRRNFIGFAFSVLEIIIKESPIDFFEEFFIFFRLMILDLKNQAEESLTENDPIFIENYHRCYLTISEMVLLYADDLEKIERIVQVYTNDYSNIKVTAPYEELKRESTSSNQAAKKVGEVTLSINQLTVMFTIFSMLARRNNANSSEIKYFDIELSSKKCSLSICSIGSFDSEANSIIISLKRLISNNSFTFEIRGMHEMKFKVDESLNKTYVRSLLDTKPGVTRDGVHKWKVLEKHKTIQAILYSHIAVYVLLKGSLSAEKLDKHNFIVDTLLNFAVVNNSGVSSHSISTLSSVALSSPTFFESTLFNRLSFKLMNFEESLQNAEREKSSDFVLHPHKQKNIRDLVDRCLHGFHLDKFGKSTFISQPSVMSSNTFLEFIMAVCCPVTYNFNEVGGAKF
jgi:hypothetical protein